MRRGHLIVAALLVVVLGSGAAAALVWRPEIAPVERRSAPVADQGTLRRGAQLAALGDCITCHTAPGGATFAGGQPILTPFGTIYATNITPDAETGIGRWSEDAFKRALRAGIDREGRHLYPAFPYDHFTLLSDADIAALYAYVMSRPAVRQPNRDNELRFPYAWRPLLAGWKFLFLRKGPYKADPAADEVASRGAYLVEGIGHCGACHTPRNALGAEKTTRAFAGGDAEGWRAFTINASSPSPVPWDRDSLYAYLRQGYHGRHGVARGPMGAVANNLASAPDSDVFAIATYVAAVMGEPDAERRAKGETLARLRPDQPGQRPQSAGSQTVASGPATGEGDVIYASACASCHDAGRPVPFGGLDLSLSTAVSAGSARNFMNVVVAGLAPADGARGAIMPGFAAVLSDEQLVALAAAVRKRFARKGSWNGVEADIAAARQLAAGEGSALSAAANPAQPRNEER